MNLNKQTTFRKQPSFPWARGLLMTGVLLLTLGHVSPQAQAQDLQKLQEQVTRMERQMRVFLSSYRNINLKRSNVSLRKRLADGQLNFLPKDYVR
ncbi:MAG TPA: hypothetical protein DCE42_21285, partial [Myxococcales bacterium]|nr:hypothetical protein [Myxococcales bacterium]